MIAPEGKIIIIPLLLFVLAGTGIQAYYPSEGLKWINLALAVLTLFSLYFFRDPQRISPNNNGFLSPADGKVSVLREDGESNIRVGIFMNIHNVHVNRAPITGYVIGLEYIRGKFLPAFSKDSERNERVRIVFSDIDPNKNNTGNVDGIGREWEVILIAGAIVRRIKPYVKIGSAT